MSGANSSTKDPSCGWAAVFLLAVLVLLGRIPDLFVHYHDWDEAAMMAQAWAMTRGQVLYKDISQFHPILNLALWVPFFHLFRPDRVPFATKAMNLVLVFVGALLTGRIAFAWLASRTLSLLGAALFIFYCSQPWAASSYGEFYLIFPVLCSVWLLFFSGEPTRPAVFYVVGSLWGAAVFLKQVAVFDAIGLYFGYLYLSQSPAKTKAAATILLGLGFLSVAVMISAYLAYHGVLSAAWHSTVARALWYAQPSGGIRARAIRLASRVFTQLGPSLPAVAGAVYVLLHRAGRRLPDRLKGGAFFVVLWIWLCADMIGLYAVGRVYAHYLTQVVPLASLLPLFILSRVETRVGRAVALCSLLALTMFLSVEFAQAMLGLRDVGWVPRPVRQSAAVADFVKRHTRDDDRIFVYRAHNIDVFFLAQRLPANGIYQYPDMMVEHMHDQAEQARARREFLSHLPAVIVVDPESRQKEVDPFLEEVLRKHYSLETSLDGLRLYTRNHR